jgi:hypothetical protein
VWRALAVIVLLCARIARGDVDADLAAIAKAAPVCDAARAHCIGIHLHVAAGERGADATPEWVAAELAAANRHFAPLDVAFQLAGLDALPASAEHVATRADRDALATDRMVGKVIHVFVVGKLDDVDKDGQIAYGVTWRTRRGDRKYVIVSNVALERTLAHELGHFFGLPHSTYAVSIMNKGERADPPPEQRTFADEEIAAMRPVLRRLLRDKVIADVAARP